MAGVPHYVGSRFDDTPPGHRFGPYFKIWSNRDWSLQKGSKTQALCEVCQFSASTRLLLDALRGRQRQRAERLDERVLVIETQSEGPLVTGTGIEHPVENGFSFLSPYGLPYLAGSGVKGAIRRAAEDLALAVPQSRWTPLHAWWLLGFDATAAYLVGPRHGDAVFLRDTAQDMQQAYLQWASTFDARDGELLERFVRRTLPREEHGRWLDGTVESLRAFLRALALPRKQSRLRDEVHLRGSLGFWDVFPATDRLEVDILTPHATSYYQDGAPPTDSESPVPNPFLVIPAGAQFHFFVEFTPVSALPEAISAGWRELAVEAFRFACELGGFGAKTGVGYGALTISRVLRGVRRR